jgi:hypothetical protein
MRHLTTTADVDTLAAAASAAFAREGRRRPPTLAHHDRAARLEPVCDEAPIDPVLRVDDPDVPG